MFRPVRIIMLCYIVLITLPIPVAEWSKATVCSRSLAVVAGSYPAGVINVCIQVKDKKSKCRTIKTNKLLRMKYKGRTKNPGGGGDFLHPSRLALGPTQPPIQ